MNSLKGKNILVTGAAGFIGSHLVDRLLQEPIAKVIGADNFFLGKKSNLAVATKYPNFIFEKLDVTDFDLLAKLINTYRINTIFHLAVIPLEVSLTKPVFCFEQNISMTQNILEILKKRKEIELVLFSSSEVYGSALYTPMDEKHPLFPQTPYAASKISSDLLAYSYYQSFDLKLLVVRPFNNYGPRQNEGSYAGVIPLTIKRILTGQRPIIHGDGKQTRDFIYVQDTVNLTMELYRRTDFKGGIFNLASGLQISINELINQICLILKYQGKIDFQPNRLGDVRIHQAGTSRAKKIIPYKLNYNFSQGIKLTVDWYKKNLL